MVLYILLPITTNRHRQWITSIPCGPVVALLSNGSRHFHHSSPWTKFEKSIPKHSPMTRVFIIYRNGSGVQKICSLDHGSISSLRSSYSSSTHPFSLPPRATQPSTLELCHPSKPTSFAYHPRRKRENQCHLYVLWDGSLTWDIPNLTSCGTDPWGEKLAIPRECEWVNWLHCIIR